MSSENAHRQNFPAWVCVQESSFWGRTGKWAGPHFAALQFGAFHVYKVSQKIEFEVNFNDPGTYIVVEKNLGKPSTQDIALRVVSNAQSQSSQTRNFYINCASKHDRVQWMNALRSIVPAHQIKGDENIVSDRDSPQQARLPSQHAERVLRDDVVLCSSSSTQGAKGNGDDQLPESEGLEKRTWSRRFMRLTNLGQLQFFRVSPLACVCMQASGAQILVEEAAASLVSPLSRKAKMSTARTMHLAKTALIQADQKNERSESTGNGELQWTVNVEEQKRTKLSSPSTEDDIDGSSSSLFDDIGAVDVDSLDSFSDSGSDESSTLSARPVAGSPSAESYKSEVAHTQPWMVRMIRKGTGELQFYPFTITGSKVRELPTFPLERSTTGLANFWRKALKASSVTVGAYSELERRKLTDDVQLYLQHCRRKLMQQRKRETESAHVISKGWMMMRTTRSLGTWKRRFCVLLSSQELVYYKNELDGSRYRVIELSRVRKGSFSIRKLPPKAPSESALEIRIRKKRAFLFYPCEQSEKVLLDWLKHLQSLGSESPSSPHTANSKTSVDSSSTTPSPESRGEGLTSASSPNSSLDLSFRSLGSPHELPSLLTPKLASPVGPDGIRKNLPNYMLQGYEHSDGTAPGPKVSHRTPEFRAASLGADGTGASEAALNKYEEYRPRRTEPEIKYSTSNEAAARARDSWGTTGLNVYSQEAQLGFPNQSKVQAGNVKLEAKSEAATISQAIDDQAKERNSTKTTEGVTASSRPLARTASSSTMVTMSSVSDTMSGVGAGGGAGTDGGEAKNNNQPELPQYSSDNSHAAGITRRDPGVSLGTDEAQVGPRPVAYSAPDMNTEISDTLVSDAAREMSLRATGGSTAWRRRVGGSPVVAIPPLSRKASFRQHIGASFPASPFSNVGAIGITASNLSRIKSFSSAASVPDGSPSSRSSSFDAGSTSLNMMMPHFTTMERSRSGGNWEELFGTCDRSEEIYGYAKVIERSNWQRMTGNAPIECLSLSPYSGAILAEMLTTEKGSDSAPLDSKLHPSTRSEMRTYTDIPPR